MALENAKVTIEGTSALLMHRFPLEEIEAIEKKPKEEQAEIAAYRDPDGKLYVPSVCIQRSFIGAATYQKFKGNLTLMKPAAACLLVTPERVLLLSNKGNPGYTIDSRAVVIPRTKGRIIRHRPRIDEWKLRFELEWDDTLLKKEQVRRIVDDAGKRTGLLDFRPATKGPFGRFVVVSWSKG